MIIHGIVSRTWALNRGNLRSTKRLKYVCEMDINVIYTVKNFTVFLGVLNHEKFF